MKYYPLVVDKIVGGGRMSKSGENLSHFAPLKHGSSDWEDQILEQNINKVQNKLGLRRATLEKAQ